MVRECGGKALKKSITKDFDHLKVKMRLGIIGMQCLLSLRSLYRWLTEPNDKHIDTPTGGGTAGHRSARPGILCPWLRERAGF